jgi:hypothetical protein
MMYDAKLGGWHQPGHARSMVALHERDRRAEPRPALHTLHHPYHVDRREPLHSTESPMAGPLHILAQFLFVGDLI